MEQMECESLPCSKALRDAIICIGWLKLASVLWYVVLFCMTTAKSRGDMSCALRAALLAAAPLQAAHALLLFYSALEGRRAAAAASLWAGAALAAYNAALGLAGCVYFIRTGQEPLHFLLAALYLLLALSVFTVLCHDLLVVHAYKQALALKASRAAAAAAAAAAH